MSVISSRVLQGIVAGAILRGVDAATLLAAVSLSWAQLQDPEARLPSEVADRLWHHAAWLSGDDLLGVHVAQQMLPADFGGLGFAVRSSATVGESYQRIARYLRLLIADGTLSRHEEGRRARLRCTLQGPRPSRHAVECLMMTLLHIGRRGADHPFIPTLVRFRHGAPASAAALQVAFAGPLRFEQDHDELWLDRELLELPLRESEPALALVLDRHLEEQVRALPHSSGILDRVRAALLADLKNGEPTLAQTSLRLSMSPRTLQRHLRQADTTHKEMLRELREGLARRYLGEQSESIAEVTFLLGFSEVSAFHRAFKRWTGKTPLTYRQQLVR